jgi:hypothetical protein
LPSLAEAAAEVDTHGVKGGRCPKLQPSSLTARNNIDTRPEFADINALPTNHSLDLGVHLLAIIRHAELEDAESLHFLRFLYRGGVGAAILISWNLFAGAFARGEAIRARADRSAQPEGP